MILDLRFRLTLTLKNNAACVYMGDERFRLMVQADIKKYLRFTKLISTTQGLASHCEPAFKVQVDVNSKKQCSMCVHGQF